MTVCVTVVLCNEYRQHKTHTHSGTQQFSAYTLHISAYLGMSDFFRFRIWIDWFIYSFFYSRCWSHSFDFFILCRAFAGSVAVIRSFFSTHTLQPLVFWFLIFTASFFLVVAGAAQCVCVEYAKNFRFMDEPNEWMCRILFMSQLSIPWIFSPFRANALVCMCANGSVRRNASASNQIHLHCCIT